MDNFFIAGTDTGVGKTVLSLLIMRYFYRNGYTPFYLKPFQTGCDDPYDEESDAKFIYSNIDQLKEKDPAESVVCCCKNPKAPWFACRDMGKQADPEKVMKVLEEKSRGFCPVIIEAAGGLLVPVTENFLMIDMIKLSGAKIILAAKSGLGTINHTLLSIEALRKRDMAPAGIVFMDADGITASVEVISENMEAVQQFSGIQVAGVINRIDDFFGPEEKYDEIFDTFLKLNG
ncbi:MAG: dethiobiotin synthase [Deltaproteobacteria bacterium]|nr:dethiobiotin synthase [Deltaproteobacteria bacterium]